MIEELVGRLGQRFSTMLGICLEGGREQEVFKWFLASLLFGKPIPEAIAARTYGWFAREGVLSPDRILETGWDGLVRLLDEGGYVRYDFSTATRLLAIMEALNRDYGGRLGRLHDQAAETRDLEARLHALGKGIGQVTTNIFLRELRGVWPKARPFLSSLALAAAQNLGLLPSTALEEAKALKRLEATCIPCLPPGKDFVDLEAALVRLGKDHCRRLRCTSCPMRDLCPRAA